MKCYNHENDHATQIGERQTVSRYVGYPPEISHSRLEKGCRSSSGSRVRKICAGFASDGLDSTRAPSCAVFVPRRGADVLPIGALREPITYSTLNTRRVHSVPASRQCFSEPLEGRGCRTVIGRRRLESQKRAC